MGYCELWDTVGCVAYGTTAALSTHVFRGHTDEVLDLAFDSTGQQLVTASADGGSVTVCLRLYCLFVCLLQSVYYMSNWGSPQVQLVCSILPPSAVCVDCRATMERYPRYTLPPHTPPLQHFIVYLSSLGHL